jgi:hypothetical protein
MGMATRAVTIITQRLPTNAGRIPALLANREGKELRKLKSNLSLPVLAKSTINKSKIIKIAKRLRMPRT